MVSRRGFLALLSTGVAFASGCSFDRGGDSDGQRSPPGGGPTRTSPPTNTTERRPTATATRAREPTTTPTPTATEAENRTLDIRDYGAAVDGETDDTAAVREAIADADKNDTVFFPEGVTLVTGEGSSRGAAIQLDGDSVPEGLSLTGTGRDSVIRMADGQPQYHNVVFFRIHSGFEDVTIRDLRIDGNKSGQGKPGSGGHGIVSRFADSADVPIDVLIHNVWVENVNSSGITPHHGGFTIDRCTVRNCAKHGMSPDSATGVHKYDPPIVIRNSLCVGNGKEGLAPTYGIDCSGGKVVVEDTVCQGNAQGTKTTEQGVEITYRRVRLTGNDLFGYIRAGGQTDDRTLVTFEDVVSEGNQASGFRFSEDTDYQIPTEIVATNNGGDNVWVANDASVEGETIWSSRAQNAYGLAVNENATGKITNYFHYQNDRGAIQMLGALDIDEEASRMKTDIEGVPRASQVGAGTTGDPGRLEPY